MAEPPGGGLAAAAAEALAAGPAALVTVLATEGSAPRGAGARMLVTADAQAGTIGGGALEWQAAAQARAILAHPAGTWRMQDYPLGPLLGQCCGGRVRLLVERLAGADWLAAVARGEAVGAVIGAGGIERHPAGGPRPTARDRPGTSHPCASVEPSAVIRRPGADEGRSDDCSAPAVSDPRLCREAGDRAIRDGEARDQKDRDTVVSGEGSRDGMVRADGTTSALAARGPLPGAGTRYVEPLDTPRAPVLLFGAGHVGRAIAALMPGLPLALAWYDSRAEADAPGVCVEAEDALVACAAGASAATAVLILTHDHALDYRLCGAALRSPARFVGLIGSATKRARFVSRLAGEGIAPARLVCPIGIAGIAGKEPAVIALAAVAQLLALGPARGPELGPELGPAAGLA